MTKLLNSVLLIPSTWCKIDSCQQEGWVPQAACDSVSCAGLASRRCFEKSAGCLLHTATGPVRLLSFLMELNYELILNLPSPPFSFVFCVTEFC